MSYEVALTLAGWFGGRVHHVVVFSDEMACEYESFDHFQAGSPPIRRID